MEARTQNNIITIRTNNDENKSVPISLLQTILRIKLIFGENKGVIKNNSTVIEFLLKIYLIILSIVVPCIFLHEIISRRTIKQVFWNGSCAVEYLCLNLSVILKDKKDHEQFWEKINKIHKDLRFTDDYYKNMLKVNIYVYMFIIVQIITYIIHAIYSPDQILIYIVVGLFLHISLDIEYSWRCIYYFYILFSLKWLKLKIKEYCFKCYRRYINVTIDRCNLSSHCELYRSVVELINFNGGSRNTIVSGIYLCMR